MSGSDHIDLDRAPLTDEQREFLASRGERRFGAYYYAFVPTGDEAVDLILAAVACAGKLAHNTCDWTDRDHYLTNYLATPAEFIQRAANSAAAELARPVGSRNDAEQAVLDAVGEFLASRAAVADAHDARLFAGGDWERCHAAEQRSEAAFDALETAWSSLPSPGGPET